MCVRILCANHAACQLNASLWAQASSDITGFHPHPSVSCVCFRVHPLLTFLLALLSFTIQTLQACEIDNYLSPCGGGKISSFAIVLECSGWFFVLIVRFCVQVLDFLPKSAIHWIEFSACDRPMEYLFFAWFLLTKRPTSIRLRVSSWLVFIFTPIV